MSNRSFQPPRVWSQWSNRILILSLLGITYFTFFPFRIDFAAHHPGPTGPLFLLGALLEAQRVTSVSFLNVLLFIPFGFGVSAQFRKRGVSKGRGLILAMAAGAVTSYAVELLQFYIPTRSSAWDDVTPNTLGAVCGFLLFNQCGEMLLNPLTAWEEKIEKWVSLRWATFFLLAYLGFFFLLSIPLQRETRLSDWDLDAPMFVGSDGTGRHAWKGQIAKFQVWNRALSEESARKLTSGEPAPGTESGLLASYEFSGAPPFEDHQKSLPALAWISSSPPRESNALDLNGSSWLSTKASVSRLAEDLQRTNQFSLHIVCTPAGSTNLEESIVYVWQLYQTANLVLRRDGADLAFWFRSPLSIHRSFLTWRVRGVFVPGQPRDILVTSDGSNVSLYLDGKKASRNYHLGPGAALIHKFTRIYAYSMDGYLVIYDTLIYFPAGMLLGTIARKQASQVTAGRLLLFLGLLLPSALYQFILVWVSGKSVSWQEILLCVLLTLLGAWFINADRDDGVLFRGPAHRSLEVA